MDICSHAIAGAAVGLHYNRPLTGALVAILPDLPLYGKTRRKYPTQLYIFTHSFFFIGLASLLLGHFLSYSLVFWALVSHLVLDVPTHGRLWAPYTLWPSSVRATFFEEWEFFNRSWLVGLFITLLWSAIWLIL